MNLELSSRRLPSDATGRRLFSLFSAWFPGGATISRPYLGCQPPLSEPCWRYSRARLLTCAIHAPLSGALCDAILSPPIFHGCARVVFPRIARPCVVSFPPAALPAIFGTTRQSDSPCPLVPPLLLRLLVPSPIHGRGHGVSRVAALSHCHACHGLRPRGAVAARPLAAAPVLTSEHCDAVVHSHVLSFRGSIPSTFRLTAYMLAVLRIRLGIAPFPPRTRYPADGQSLPGRGSHPLDNATLPGRTGPPGPLGITCAGQLYRA